MMKRCFIAMVSLLTVFSTIAHGVYGNDWKSHRVALKAKFNTSYWKDCWNDETWHIRCIFVDMDGDGTEEMIATTTSEEDRMGDYWKIWKARRSGEFKRVSISGNIFFSCHATSFYRMSYSDRPDAVVGLGMDAGIEEDCGNGERRKVKSISDCRFVMTSEDNYRLEEIQPDIDAMFRLGNVVAIERLYPEWYFGFDFTPPKNDPHSPYTSWMPYRPPKGDLRRGGGVVEPDDFAAFVDAYRRKVKMATNTEKSVTVYAVHLDVDNDGDVDSYVSSDSERMKNGLFRWSLYLRKGKAFSKASRCVYPIKSRKELCSLKPQVVADKDSFCRIVRFDVEPLFMILEESTGGATKVRNVAMGLETHRVEKLVCVEYPEK